MGDLGFSINKDAEKEFVQEIRTKLRMLRYDGNGYQFSELGNKYTFSIMDLIHNLNCIFKNDAVLMCSTVVKYLANWCGKLFSWNLQIYNNYLT